MNESLFAVRQVETHLRVYGLEDELPPGALPRIEEAVNAQEVFSSSSRIPRRFMRLQGENWEIQFDTREASILGTGFLDCRQVEEGVSFFLGQIREAVHCHFWAERIKVHAEWPLEENPRRKKFAGQILYEKSSRLKPEQLALLPTGAILGAGISLLGLMPREEGEPPATWMLDAGPVGDSLMLTLETTFFEPERRDWPDDELGTITSNIQTTYGIMDNEVKAFIGAVMP